MNLQTSVSGIIGWMVAGLYSWLVTAAISLGVFLLFAFGFQDRKLGETLLNETGIAMLENKTELV